MEELKLALEFIKNVGAPYTLLGALLYGAFRYFLIPMEDAHLELVTSLKTTVAQQAENGKKMTALQEQQANLMESQDKSTKMLVVGVQALACNQVKR